VNPLRDNGSFTPPDAHFHVCEHCGWDFWHRKSEIPAGDSFVAHLCPLCGLAVNSAPQALAVPRSDTPWYGG
jgi:hypothetical protein